MTSDKTKKNCSPLNVANATISSPAMVNAHAIGISFNVPNSGQKLNACGVGVVQAAVLIEQLIDLLDLLRLALDLPDVAEFHFIILPIRKK